MTIEGGSAPAWLSSIPGDYAVVLFGYVLVYRIGFRAICFDLAGNRV